MKHCRSLASEPPELSDYLRSLDPESEISTSAAWRRFRDSPAYESLRRRLIEAQQGLCAYCEQKLVDGGEPIALDMQVEHILPKHEGPERVLDWTNLVLCCGGGAYRYHRDPSRRYAGKENLSCGQAKADRLLDETCDPRRLPLVPALFRVGIDGTLAVDEQACQAIGIDTDLLKATIDDLLNLNCERLRSRRQEIRANLQETLLSLLESLSPNAEERKSAMLKVVLEDRLAPDQDGILHAFWTTERHVLEPWADAWLKEHHERFAGPGPS